MTPDETLERAAQIMADHEVAHLIVVAPDEPLPQGVLSTLDVAGAMAAAS